MADEILVNSKFTQSIFKQEFPWISKVPKVLYPCVNIDSYTKDGAVFSDQLKT
jgi:alpha-1,3/alpha-1,6-mannosyltransferase